MNARFIDADDALATPFYMFGALLIATPLMDLFTSILPLQVMNIQWRFASVGLGSGFLLTPILGIAVFMAVAAVREHWLFQRVIALTNGIVTVALIALLAGFLLDVIQLNSVVPEDGTAAFRSAAFKAVFKYATTIVVMGSMTIAGWRISSWSLSHR